LPVRGGCKPIHARRYVVGGQQRARQEKRDGQGKVVCHWTCLTFMMPQTARSFQDSQRPREHGSEEPRILQAATKESFVMQFMANPRFLTIYSGVLTTVFAVTILGGFAGPAKKSAFDEISVQRINIAEPDAALRMVLCHKARVPGLIVKGKEYPRKDRQTAGVLFFDDEGTENGGLIFGGIKGKDGKVESWGTLSFDR
jgi:hypothetical protein